MKSKFQNIQSIESIKVGIFNLEDKLKECGEGGESN